MSTELSLVNAEANKDSRIMAIRPDSPLIEAYEENAGIMEPLTVRDLIVVKVPSGGAVSWEIDDVDGVKSQPEIVGVVVAYAKSGVIWPYAKQKEGSMPFIRTDDLVEGVEVGDDPGDLDTDLMDECKIGERDGRNIYDWQKLRQAFWNVDPELGKRVKENRLIGIIREDDPMPIIVRVPPASLKHVVSKMKLMMYKCPMSRLVVSMKLEKCTSSSGDTYSEVRITQVGMLSADEGKAIKQLFVEPLKSTVKDVAQQVNDLDDDSSDVDDDMPL